MPRSWLRFQWSVRSLLAIPIALHALIGAGVVGYWVHRHNQELLKASVNEALIAKTALIRMQLESEFRFVQQQAIAFATELEFLETPTAIAAYFERQQRVFGLASVVYQAPTGARVGSTNVDTGIAIGSRAPAWGLRGDALVAHADTPDGGVVSVSRDLTTLVPQLEAVLAVQSMCVSLQSSAWQSDVTNPDCASAIAAASLDTTVQLQQGYWIYRTTYQDSAGLDWSVGVALLNQDLKIPTPWLSTLTVVALLLGSSTLASIAIAQYLIRPLKRLATTADSISSGENSLTFEPVGIRELDTLAAAMLTITQRLRTQIEQLEYSQARLNYILDDLPIGIAIHKQDGAVSYVNKAGRTILNLSTSPSGDLAKLVEALAIYQAGSNDPYPPQNLPVSYALRGQATIKDDIEIHLNEQRLQLRVSAVPLRDAHSQVVGAVTAFEDVTASRLTARLQNEYLAGLDQQFQEIQRLNSLKEDFLSTVSHELRTPIANMRMAMQMLQIALYDIELPDALSKRLQQYFQILQQECHREMQLIEDLLSLSLTTAEGTTKNLREIMVLPWLQNLTQSFYARLEAQEQRLSIQVATTIPPLTTDPTLLERAFVELLNNACKYTPRGGQITISVDANPTQLTFVLSNTGIQIPARDLPYIFDKFYRVPGSNPWAQGGTGLGLALVKKLVEHLGGQITAQSQANQVDFLMTLPLLG